VVASFGQQLLHRTNMIGQTSGDGWRCLQRTVNLAEIVDTKLQAHHRVV
jgi:hypothetical protein